MGMFQGTQSWGVHKINQSFEEGFRKEFFVCWFSRKKKVVASKIHRDKH